MNEADLDGFERYHQPDRPDGRAVYRRGPAGGPPVIVLHELPGMVPETVTLARDLAAPATDDPNDTGFDVHLPLLFGQPGQEADGNLAMARSMWCIRSEIRLLAKDGPSPITRWIAGLVDRIGGEAGGRPVGVIGMCLTGGLVFGLVRQPGVGALVASQPSLPIGLTGAHRRALGVPPEDLAGAAEDGNPLLAMRYRGDSLCPRDRLAHLAERYGGQLPPADTGDTLDERYGTLRIIERPGDDHSLLTIDRDDQVVATVRDFLRQNL
ncbi:MAG: hypothetical protein AAF547_24025 [Actinomycetota bacterium]